MNLHVLNLGAGVQSTTLYQQAIRRDLLHLAPGRTVPRSITVTQYYGISTDESSRANRIIAAEHRVNWSVRFPLIERGMSRRDCIAWLETRGEVPHKVPRSACVFCPFHTDAEWLRLKTEAPADFARACEIDTALREPGRIVNRNMDQLLWLHPSVRPLIGIDFAPNASFEFGVETQDCEGMCGI